MSDFIPSSELLESRLESLEVRIPSFDIVDRIDGLKVDGTWAAAVGSINHPRPKEGSRPVMLFAVFVVLDLSANIVRLANPLPSGQFRVETIHKYLAGSMTDSLQGQPERPRTLICPQERLAKTLEPLALKVGIEIRVTDEPAFERIFDVLEDDLMQEGPEF